MFGRRLRILVILLTTLSGVKAQQCTVAGQTPATAFPVCGTTTFKQQTVPTCVNHLVPVACTDGAGYADKNPFWYKFTCFSGGTLGFEISPITYSDDYDWQLFDVTGHSPDEVYTNTSLFVSGNWSHLPGPTGASPQGVGSVNCSGNSHPNQNAMPLLIKGHNYLLLVSHFDDSQSGYSLEFSGGTASITDTTPPAVLAAQPSCDGTKINIILNKKMRCASLDPDGSDFSISPAGVTIAGAQGGCGGGFDMDTVTLTLSGTLLPGNYTVTVQNGKDQNSLLDNCDAQVPAGSTVQFIKPAAPQPTPLDSLTPLGCRPGILQLVFSKKIRCATVADDGSNFKITGPSAVTIIGTGVQCDGNGETPVIQLKLASPIVVGGTYQITLVSTIVDECGQPTPVGSTLNFTAYDTVSAAFNEDILYGCRSDTIAYHYLTRNGVNVWRWIFDGSDTVWTPEPRRIYSVFGIKTAQLYVSNGVCADSATYTVNLDNGIKAAFEAPNLLCPKDLAEFKNNSTGKISGWTWDFGDGTGSTLQQPPGHLYPQTGRETKYTVSLIVENAAGCRDTALNAIDVLKSCYIAVPSAFTPNGDGLNDYLYPLNALKADNLEFKVFNRYGQLVFETKDWQKKWDGTVNGHPEPAGTYVWMLQYTDRDTGRKFFQKGTTLLIR